MGKGGGEVFFEGRVVLKLLGRWLKVYKEEMGLFLWSALLLFLIRSSSVILNNYAETAFLKRHSVSSTVSAG